MTNVLPDQPPTTPPPDPRDAYETAARCLTQARWTEPAPRADALALAEFQNAVTRAQAALRAYADAVARAQAESHAVAAHRGGAL